ncbi:MAG TPA: DUF4153 domain-containing protein, partial [bacterium]|nr:DUF4153 domain-containing protein [bacterium]
PLTVAIGSLLAIWFLQKLLSGSKLDTTSVGAILTLGAVALLTYLLLFPLEQESGQRWLKIFRRAFFAALLPFLVVFLYQAWRLVQSYGWTPPRYYGLILLSWGAALSLYLVLSRRPHIIWIPVTLSLLALSTLTGPWSAVPLAQASQIRRLKAMLGGPLPLDQQRMLALRPETRSQLESQVAYVENNFGCEELRPFFGQLLANRRQIDTTCSTIDLFRLLRRDAALPPEELEAEIVNVNFMEDSSSSNKVLKIRGYDLYFSSSAMEYPPQPEKGPPECPDYPEARPICILRPKESYQIEIFRNRKSLGKIDLEPMVTALTNKYLSEKVKEGEDPHYRTFNLPTTDLSFETRLGGRPARIDFEHLRLEQRGQRVSPEDIRFSL